MDAAKQFTKHLHKRFTQSTVNTYSKTIKELTARYGINPSIKNLNEFIGEKSQRYTKCAIKEYLNFVGRGSDCKMLAEIESDATEKKTLFLTNEQVKNILNNFDNQMHKTIAILQVVGGAKASEILVIGKKDIHREVKDGENVIRINVKGRREGWRNIYIDDMYWKFIEPYYIRVKPLRKYLFLNETELTYFNFWIKVETAYKKYLSGLQKAALKCGLSVTTHDLKQKMDMVESGNKAIEI